ncbi:MAG: helix-turn-helix domain-containing protein [Pannonibacter sp.]
MTDWSPYCDTAKPDALPGAEGAAISVADVLVDPPANSPDDPFARGRHRAKMLTPNLQYLDCNLTTTEPLSASGIVAPGVMVTHAFSGAWHSEVDGRSLDLTACDDTVVYGASRPLPFLENQSENASIEMASLYVSADFFEMDADDGLSPGVFMKLMQGDSLVTHRLCRAVSVQRLLRQMYDTPIDGYLARLHLASLGYAVLAELGGILGASRTCSPASRRQRDLAMALREYLDRHVTSLPTVPDMAEQFATNESTLRRAFKTTFGVSITVYVRTELLKQAQMQLRDGRQQIAEIAYRCGFSSPANFSSAYRRHFGHPPGTERGKNA